MNICKACEEENSPRARFCQGCGAALSLNPGASQAVRKTVSVVSCDLISLDDPPGAFYPAVAERLATRLASPVETILNRHGGTLESLTGGSIRVIFGIPISHEDDALRAVKAASEIRGMVDVVYEELGVAASVRLGVNTGQAVAGDASHGPASVSGEALDAAVRLSRSAPSGQVLLSVSTLRLVRDAVEVEPAEVSEEATGPSYRLVEIIPGAVMGIDRNHSSEIIGRTGEMRLLKQLFKETVANQACRVATLFGPAGVGKSRLAAEFGDWGQGQAHVMTGRCLPYGEAITFWPITEALKAFIGLDDRTTEEETLEKIGSLVPSDDQQSLICERITAMMGLSAETPSAQEIFWAVKKLLEEVARDRPVILMLDDIHWAEPTLLDLIEHIGSSSHRSRILLLCQSRNELIDTRPSWGTVSESIPVDPLSDDQVRALTDRLLGDIRLPEPVSRKIRNAAEGNPLYVEEILRMLLDEGALIQDKHGFRVARDTESVAIPPTIQALLAARLDRLQPDERLVLQAASVVGKTFWGGAVSDLLPEHVRPRLPHYLQGLCRKELVFPERSTFTGEDAYRFGHILMRDATYSALPENTRAEMHEGFAAWLENKAGERLREYEEILGYHLEQAYKLNQEKDDSSVNHRERAERAWTILSSVGRRAYARADMPAAVSLLRRASDLLPEGGLRKIELSADLADALKETGDFERAKLVLDHAVEVATAEGEEAAAGRAAIQLCLLKSVTGEGENQDEARALAARLIPLFASLGDELGQTRAYQLVAELEWERYRFAATEHALEQALAHARRAETAHDEARIMSFLAAVAFWGPTPVHDAIQKCEEMLRSAAGKHVLEAKIQLRLAGLKAMDGDFSDARVLLARSRVIFSEFGLDLELAASAQEAGLIALLAGDAETAEQEFRSGHDSLAAMGEMAFLSSAAALLARALYLLGEVDEAEKYADQAAGSADGDAIQPEWAPSKARIIAEQGKFEEALELARETVRIATGTDDVVLQGDAFMALGDVMRTSGDEDEAHKCYQQALEFYEVKGVLPWVERTLEALRG